MIPWNISKTNRKNINIEILTFHFCGNSLYIIPRTTSWYMLNLSKILIVRRCSVRLSWVNSYIPMIQWKTFIYIFRCIRSPLFEHQNWFHKTIETTFCSNQSLSLFFSLFLSSSSSHWLINSALMSYSKLVKLYKFFYYLDLNLEREPTVCNKKNTAQFQFEMIFPFQLAKKD